MNKCTRFSTALFVTLFSVPFGTNTDASTSAACAALDKQNPDSRQFYDDNPTYKDPTDDSNSWNLADPASEGINPNSLKNAARTLGKRPEQFSFIVARHGRPVFEQYFHGATVSSSNNVHSASKSILSAAVGIAIQEGLISGIDAYISSLLPPQYSALLTGDMKQWTLRHFLTMTSGLNWVEDQSEYSIQTTPDWIQSILNLGLSNKPGTIFNYSTAMTHLISVILTRSTGVSTCDYVRSQILDKIGVTPMRWDRDPQGYFSGGYNLYLRARDLAKFGFLVANGGTWLGEQIIPQNWLTASTTQQVSDGDSDGYFYGYNWWIKTVSGYRVAIAWGFGGQFIYWVPDLSLIVVMTTNTADYSSSATGESILSKYLIPGIKNPPTQRLNRY